MERPLELEDVLRNLHLVSGFRLSVHNLDFDEIASYPPSLSGFCGILQSVPGVRARCLEADRIALEHVSAKKELYIYRCPFGLFEAAAPLYHFGVPAGYLMMGQTLDDNPRSRQRVEELSAPYFADKEALSKIVSAIPSGSGEQIRACTSLLHICSEYITMTNRINLTEHRLAPAVRVYLGEHFRRKITVSELCGQFFCSRSTLLAAYKSAYGVTLMNTLTELRITEARRLLNGTQKSVAEIAAECGFSDQNYFSRVFREHTGLTPSDFRRQA